MYRKGILMISKNLVFKGPMQPELEEKELASPKPDELQCRASRSLISAGTEIRCLKGVFEPGTNWESWVRYPFYPGYSMAATVVAAGAEATGFKPGDRVFAHAPHCRYFNIPASMTNHIPDGVSDQEAVWTTMGRITQNGVRRAQVQLGDYVVVIGSGIVGLLTMQFAKIAGAARIIAVDMNENGLELAQKLGADYLIKSYAKEAKGEIERLTKGRMADIVFDATGNPKVLADACLLARKNGKILIIGDTTEPHKQALGPGVVSNYLTIMGAHAKMLADFDNPFYPYTWQRVHEIFYDYLMQGRIRVSELMTLEVAPEEMPELYRKLAADTTLATGIQIDWEKTENRV